MDIIKNYFKYIKNELKTEIVDNYKIITVNNKDNDEPRNIPFLIYSTNNFRLNSQSLIKLLMIKNLEPDFFSKILGSNDEVLKDIFNNICNASLLLYEDRLFFDFDPYGNFLLSSNSSPRDIKDIIKSTTSYYNSRSENHKKSLQYDFSNMINPYGREKIVFTGGGTKGIIYIGATLGLLCTGQIFYLNHFSGTSIGALSAMVIGCITPKPEEYAIIKKMNLRDILTHKSSIVSRYQEAISFATERFCNRTVDTFYTAPVYTFYGLWTVIDKIVKDNGLYDPEKSGFQIWYALICKKICHIMGNGLDEFIIIKKKDGSFVEFKDVENKKTKQTLEHNDNELIDIQITGLEDDDTDNVDTDDDYLKKYLGGIDFDNDSFEGWKIVRFFTFQEYHEHTRKTLVLTGTKTTRIETVYYTHTEPEYSNLNVMTGATASMSIPWVFKAPVINGSYNLDGGLYDNYPLTHCDKKIKDKITHYNNKIFGYLIDDKNSIIDAYEIIRELWLVYDGFIEIMKICHLKDSERYLEISELFFEIRSEIYKLLYFTDIDLETFLNKSEDRISIKGFNIRDLDDIFKVLIEHSEVSDYMNFKLPNMGISYIENMLNQLDSSHRGFESLFRIGKKTDLADIMELSVRQGEVYNKLVGLFREELKIIESMEIKMNIVIRYEDILKHIMKRIMAYYELKGTFIKNNDLEYPCRYFSEMMKELYKKVTEFEKLTNNAIIELNKNKTIEEPEIKNYMQNTIQIALTMISKILTRGSGNNIDITDLKLDENKSSWQKAIDYFFHTDMTGILYKYMCIANDRICNDSLNKMRTIKLNTFETSTLHFGMDNELKYRLIYEGYSKTIKYFTNILHIMEITGRIRSDEDYIESYELRFKKII